MILTDTDILAYSAITGVGPATIGKSVKAIQQGGGEESLAPKIAEALRDSVRREKIYDFAKRQQDQAAAHGVEIVSRINERYPSLAGERIDAPPVLFVKGSCHAFQRRQIGVIGTREPTEHGKIAVQRLTDVFSDAGFAIVSGLALGCDSISHERCVQSGGIAIAVLAHGLHTIAPKRSAGLAEQILASGGALVSEFGIGVEPQPRLFVQRDKTQALLSEAILMAQSDLKGGSLHASRAILQLDRKLLVPYPTATDIQNSEPKVQANLAIAQGSEKEKIDLLHCTRTDLAKIMIIRGRDDYTRMLAFVERTAAPVQQSLL